MGDGYPLKAVILLVLGGLSLPISIVDSMYTVSVGSFFGGISFVVPIVILLFTVLVISLGLSVMVRPDLSSLIGYVSIALGLSIVPLATTLSYVGLTTGDLPIFPQDITSFVTTILERGVTLSLVISVVLVTSGGILCVLWGKDISSISGSTET